MLCRESNPLCFLRLSFSDEQIRGDWLGKKGTETGRGENRRENKHVSQAPISPPLAPVVMPPHSLISAFTSSRVLQRRLKNEERWGGGVREKTLLFHFHWVVLGFLPADKSRAKHVASLARVCVCFSVGCVFCGCCVCSAAACKHSQTKQFQTSPSILNEIMTR